MVGLRCAVLGLVAFCFAAGCGESDRSEPDGAAGGAGANAGSGGSTGGSGGSSGSGGGGGSGGSATLAGRGGADAGAGAGDAGSSGSAGTATSGSAGRNETGGGEGGGSAGSGTAGEPAETGGGAGAPTDWRAACNGVTVNGRCDGNTYQWCDYFTRQVQTIDCGPLGMTCRALETESNEADGNGCVGEPCDGFLNHCLDDESLIADCFMGETVVTSCTKHHGRTATCSEPGESALCTPTELCDIPSHRCDGSVLRICDEDSHLHYRDCARMDPAGTCTEIDSETVDCGGVSIGFAF